MCISRGFSARRWLAFHTHAVLLFLYAPIAVLAVYSFNSARRVSAAWSGFTVHWYAVAWRDVPIQDAAFNSLLIASIATAISTVVGTAAALALARARRAPATRGLIHVPIVVPEIAMGAAMVVFFGLCRWPLGLATTLTAHVVFTVSYVGLVVRARLVGMDPALSEAARDLGATPTGAFLRVTLPLIAPGIAAAALLAFTVSLDDYVVTSFVAGPGSTTLPLKIYSMLKTEVTPEVNAVCTLLLAATVVLVGVSQRLIGRQQGSVLG